MNSAGGAPGWPFSPSNRTNTSSAGPRRAGAVRMHDGLVIQLELVVAQGALQPLQPMDLAAVARVRLLARGIHVHVHAALLLGDVAGGIGRVHEVLDRAAAAADLDQTDADADIENLVLPDEAVIVDARTTSSAICRAFSSGQPTSSSANSSPPMRPAVSESRTASLMMVATSRSMLSPAVCPQVSFTTLKRSRSR